MIQVQLGCEGANINGLDPVNFVDFSMLAQQWRLMGPDLTADIYCDEFVDMQDLAVLAEYWLHACPPYPEEAAGTTSGHDVNEDQLVDIKELTILADYWLSEDNTKPFGHYQQRRKRNLKKPHLGE